VVAHDAGDERPAPPSPRTTRRSTTTRTTKTHHRPSRISTAAAAPCRGSTDERASNRTRRCQACTVGENYADGRRSGRSLSCLREVIPSLRKMLRRIVIRLS
jgi:hypothetical protein